MTIREHDDDVIGPAVRSGLRCSTNSPRRLAAMRAYTPQAKNVPNSKIEPRSPFDNRCASAQVFTPASIGYLSLALMWLGMKAAMNKITANSIKPTVIWRMKAGGDQSSNQLMRAILGETPNDQRKADK